MHIICQAIMIQTLFKQPHLSSLDLLHGASSFTKAKLQGDFHPWPKGVPYSRLIKNASYTKLCSGKGSKWIQQEEERVEMGIYASQHQSLWTSAWRLWLKLDVHCITISQTYKGICGHNGHMLFLWSLSVIIWSVSTFLISC